MILLPELECVLTFLEISSATNEVAMLNNGMLKILDRMLKIATPIPADASSRAPSVYMTKLSQKICNSLLPCSKDESRHFKRAITRWVYAVTCLRFHISQSACSSVPQRSKASYQINKFYYILIKFT